ncbi:MAG TPA: hypothetical protein VK203_19250 [Nostocaceae cyanobacterium]|nr:hypothetical protein [Nostocaceae cyanobacterium]
MIHKLSNAIALLHNSSLRTFSYLDQANLASYFQLKRFRNEQERSPTSPILRNAIAYTTPSSEMRSPTSPITKRAIAYNPITKNAIALLHH